MQYNLISAFSTKNGDTLKSGPSFCPLSNTFSCLMDIFQEVLANLVGHVNVLVVLTIFSRVSQKKLHLTICKLTNLSS